MDALKTRGRIFGLLYLATFITSIAALVLYGPVLHHANYVLSAGSDTRIAIGVALEIALVITAIGTATVVYPLLKRDHPTLAISYVASRIVENIVIAIGFVALLAVVALRRDIAGTTSDASSALMAAKSLVAVHDATFLIGPAFCAAIGNGLILGYMMFRSGLVPRRLAMVGLIGGSFALVAALGALFNVFPQASGTSFLLTSGEIVWEGGLGIYCTVKGFKPRADVASTSSSAPKTPVFAPAV